MKYIDFFTHEQCSQDTDLLYKCRLLIGIVLAYLAIIIGFCLYLTFFSSLPAEATASGIILLLFMALCFTLVLGNMRRKGAFSTCAQTTITGSFLSIAAGVYVSGGPIDTSAGVIIVMPAILAYCLLGLRAGLYWTLAIFTANMIGVAMALGGYAFPQVAPESMATTNKVFNWVVAFISIIAIVVVYEQMNVRLKRERDQERDRYRFLATHDPLTGLGNRKLFNEALISGLKRAHRNSYPLALAIMDLNDFKPVNDEQGHDAGDAVLKHVARQIQSNIRSTDVAARLGGDEFAIILEGIYKQEDLENLLAKIQQAIETGLEYNSRQLKITASIGIAQSPTDTSDPDELIKLADESMYAAKKNKSSIHIYE